MTQGKRVPKTAGMWYTFTCPTPQEGERDDFPQTWNFPDAPGFNNEIVERYREGPEWFSFRPRFPYYSVARVLNWCSVSEVLVEGACFGTFVKSQVPIGLNDAKATGTENIADKLWREKSWDPTLRLSELPNLVTEVGRTPSDWSESRTISVLKRKAVQQHVLITSNPVVDSYHENFERTFVNVRSNNRESAGFVKNCGTTALLLVDLHWISDSKKAFSYFPHKLFQYALRQHFVKKELVRWVKFLYCNPKSKVPSGAGILKLLHVFVGVH